MISVYTSNGWEDIDPANMYGIVEDITCCDCPEPAVVITENGSPDILWAQCDGCADESRACTLDAKLQAEYECEY